MCQALGSIHGMCSGWKVLTHTTAVSAIFHGDRAGWSTLCLREELPVCRDGEEGTLCLSELWGHHGTGEGSPRYVWGPATGTDGSSDETGNFCPEVSLAPGRGWSAEAMAARLLPQRVLASEVA